MHNLVPGTIAAYNTIEHSTINIYENFKRTQIYKS